MLLTGWEISTCSLWDIIQAVGVTHRFIAMIRTFHCDTERILKVSDGMCAPFLVRQG